jgi:hypothetical protein
MTSDNPALDRIRKLLAKAEAHGVTPAEAEALTAKAAELMARYGIDRALLAATQPCTDQPADRIIDIPNPWAAVHAHLMCGLGSAMRCRCLLLPAAAAGAGTRVHIFGYDADIERTEVLYTSLLLQMRSALNHAAMPAWITSPRAWRRSWLLGYATAVIARVRTAEHNAAAQASGEQATGTGQTAAVVLASREQVIARRAQTAYPVTRKSKVTYSGSGYRDGYHQGTQADIGGTRLTRRPRRSLR